MEYELYTNDSNSPVAITIDPDNGIYTVRKEDTSGEVFNSSAELVAWFQSHYEKNQFLKPHQFNSFLSEANQLNDPSS
ncbi:threonine dehydratase [Bacillus coahuilensis m2-6]|uniref:Threonine dehydratase n=1 Tax=Bacillus coahuilensis p1.1.43 TaxID=1150625 RepID=A0A147K8G0_9BACI|nr:hypothetical protein [Bacillus coahuilensis]KUP06491.1 threonine dehydratase [Bacillus coahuilensis p1.1.43]KUP07978.1 threonine dehydratase [Bacillus coahuilensis m2-6]